MGRHRLLTGQSTTLIIRRVIEIYQLTLVQVAASDVVVLVVGIQREQREQRGEQRRRPGLDSRDGVRQREPGLVRQSHAPLGHRRRGRRMEHRLLPQRRGHARVLSRSRPSIIFLLFIM